MSENNRYISGEWYEREYQSGWYHDQYVAKEEPQWAKQCDNYCIDLMVAYTGIDRSAKILDLGSGVGQVMKTWKRKGFLFVRGIEISYVAIRYSGNPNIVHGTVADMDMFGDNEFDLVASLALFEHIDESILPQAMSEICRVGKRQAHFMAHDAGDDPSHINIKTIEEWAEVMSRYTQGVTFTVDNICAPNDPLLVSMPEDLLTHPVRCYLGESEQILLGETCE